MADLGLIYRKTAAGNEELAAKRLGLSREQRNLLIVADGRHSLAVYCKAVGCDPEKMSRLADDLLALALIEAGPGVAAHHPAAMANHTEPTAAAPAQGLAESCEVLRHQVVDLARSVFGEQLAAPVIARLEKAHATTGELMAAVESAAKLAKLTIDETKAQTFLAEARRIVGF